MRKFTILILLLLIGSGGVFAANYTGEYDYFHAFSHDGNYALFSRIGVMEGFNRLLIYGGGQKTAQEEINAMELELAGERESVSFDKAILGLAQIKARGFDDRGTSGLISPSGSHKVSFNLDIKEAQYLDEQSGQWIPSFTGVLKILLNDKLINELSLGNWSDPALSAEQINKINVHWSRDEGAAAFFGFLLTGSESESKVYSPVSFLFPLKLSSLSYIIEQKARAKLNENIKVEVSRIDEDGGRYLVKVYFKNTKKLGGEQAEVFYDVLKEYVYLTGEGKLMEKE
jgi:hypothetical protein